MFFLFTKESFNNNIDLTIFINLLIYIAMLLFIPILLVLLVAVVKPRIKKSSNIYLYALSAGMLLIIGTTGFLKESYSGLEEGVHENLASWNLSSFQEQAIIMSIVVGGSILGIGTIFGVRYFFVKKLGKDTHSNHKEHDHHDHIVSFNDVDNPKAAWLAILLLLSHRTIDGFILGSSVSKISNGEPINLGLIITFNIHILIEILIVYYRQIQYGQKTKKAVIYNLMTTLLLIPIMFVGAFINRHLQTIWWLVPFINASGGSIITIVVVIELVPEFIHLRNESKKEWYLSLVSFGIGIIFTLGMLAFHQHEEVKEATHAHEFIQLVKNKIW